MYAGRGHEQRLLSDVQLAALKRINDPKSLSYVIGTGESSIPGYPVYLADHGGGVPNAVHKLLTHAGGDGAARVDSFVRYYEISGAQHGPSSAFQPDWDQLATIENWVEKNIDPANNIVATDDAGVPGRIKAAVHVPQLAKVRRIRRRQQRKILHLCFTVIA